MQNLETIGAVITALDRLVLTLGDEESKSGIAWSQKHRYLTVRVLQTKGDLRECIRGGEVNGENLIYHFPHLARLSEVDFHWALRTITRFYRAYFRLIFLNFPKFEMKAEEIDLACGRDIHTTKDLIDLLKVVCTSPMEHAVNFKGCSSGSLLVPVTGSGYQYLKQAFRRRGRATVVFANGVFQLKRTCPRVPKSFVDEALRKHMRAVATPRETEPSFYRQLITQAHMVLNSMGALGTYEFPVDQDVTSLSSKATVESGIKGGGGYGYYQGYHGTDVDHNGDFRPMIRYWDKSDNGVVTYMARMLPTYGQLIREFRGVLLGGLPQRKVVGIEEPLKVRVITTHHASEANGFGHIQKWLAKRLLRRREFTTGRPTVDADGVPVDFVSKDFDEIDRVLEAWGGLGYSRDLMAFISDDAEAATDSIPMNVSESVSDGIWGRTRDGSSGHLARDALAQSWRGVLKYRFSDKTTASVEQATGQMMGHRVSFPILCVTHLAAMELFWDAKQVPKRCRFARINGDDKVVILPLVWKEDYFAHMGQLWGISRTKTYVSRDFFSFNSQLWDIRKRQQVQRHRMSLVDGIDKGGSNLTDPRVWNVIARSAPEKSLESLLRMFCSSPVWQPILKRATAAGQNWFLPTVCGGVGMMYDRQSLFITPRQKTAVIAALEGELEKYKTVIRSCTRIRQVGMRVQAPVFDGQAPVRQVEPIARTLKPERDTEPRVMHFREAPKVRSWRTVTPDEVASLWEARPHYCLYGVGACERCKIIIEHTF